jgi:hypothetical protein
MFDATRIFRPFYTRHIKACGTSCVFFTLDNKKKKFDYTTARQIQGRIIHHIYDIGWRWPKVSGYSAFNKQICKYGHIACQPERLSEKDWFPISKLMEPICDSLNSTR